MVILANDPFCCCALHIIKGKNELVRMCYTGLSEMKNPNDIRETAISAPLGLEIVESQLEAARRASLVSKFPTLFVAISSIPAGKNHRCRELLILNTRRLDVPGIRACSSCLACALWYPYHFIPYQHRNTTNL